MRAGRWTRRTPVGSVQLMPRPGTPEYDKKVAEVAASAPPLTDDQREPIARILAHPAADEPVEPAV